MSVLAYTHPLVPANRQQPFEGRGGGQESVWGLQRGILLAGHINQQIDY